MDLTLENKPCFHLCMLSGMSPIPTAKGFASPLNSGRFSDALVSPGSSGSEVLQHPPTAQSEWPSAHLLALGRSAQASNSLQRGSCLPFCVFPYRSSTDQGASSSVFEEAYAEGTSCDHIQSKTTLAGPGSGGRGKEREREREGERAQFALDPN